METLKKIRDGLEKIQITLGVIFISIFLITILIQIGSSVLKISVTWTEDLAKNSFIWAIFMGAAWGVNRDEHFAFTSLNDNLSGRKKIIHKMIIHAISLIFSLAILKYGIDSTIKFWNYRWPNIQNFKMGYVWLSLPVTGATMSFYLLAHILEGFEKLKKLEEGSGK